MNAFVDAVNALGAQWADGFDEYASTGDTSAVTCVLCTTKPCCCPPFGTPEYLALHDRRHGHRSG